MPKRLGGRRHAGEMGSPSACRRIPPACSLSTLGEYPQLAVQELGCGTDETAGHASAARRSSFFTLDCVRMRKTAAVGTPW